MGHSVFGTSMQRVGGKGRAQSKSQQGDGPCVYFVRVVS